jgi:hypothetical protein
LDPKTEKEIIHQFVYHLKSNGVALESTDSAIIAQSPSNTTLSNEEQKQLEALLASDPNRAASDKNPDPEVFHHAPCILSLLLHRGNIKIASALLKSYAYHGVRLEQTNLDAAFLRLVTSVDEEKFKQHNSTYTNIFLMLLIMGADVNTCDPDGYSALALCHVFAQTIPSFIVSCLTKLGAIAIDPMEKGQAYVCRKNSDTIIIP